LPKDSKDGNSIYPKDLDIREFFLSKKNRIHCSNILKGKLEQEELEDLLDIIGDSMRGGRKH